MTVNGKARDRNFTSNRCCNSKHEADAMKYRGDILIRICVFNGNTVENTKPLLSAMFVDACAKKDMYEHIEVILLPLAR